VNNEHNYSTVTPHNHPVHNCDKRLRTIATCCVDSHRQSVQNRTFNPFALPDHSLYSHSPTFVRDAFHGTLRTSNFTYVGIHINSIQYEFVIRQPSGIQLWQTAKDNRHLLRWFPQTVGSKSDLQPGCLARSFAVQPLPYIRKGCVPRDFTDVEFYVCQNSHKLNSIRICYPTRRNNYKTVLRNLQ